MVKIEAKLAELLLMAEECYRGALHRGIATEDWPHFYASFLLRNGLPAVMSSYAVEEIMEDQM